MDIFCGILTLVIELGIVAFFRYIHSFSEITAHISAKYQVATVFLDGLMFPAMFTCLLCDRGIVIK